VARTANRPIHSYLTLAASNIFSVKLVLDISMMQLNSWLKVRWRHPTTPTVETRLAHTYHHVPLLKPFDIWW